MSTEEAVRVRSVPPNLIRSDKMKTDIAIDKLDKDIKEACKIMGRREVRFLVNLYYDIQEQRIGMAGRVRELVKMDEPNVIYDYLARNMEFFETRIRQSLKVYVDNNIVGQWIISITGIGPVISAGLIANLDMNIDATLKDEEGNYVKIFGKNPSSFWRICGQDPSQKRERGKKLTYNPNLKRLCYIIGESFVKVQNNKNDFYGKLYVDYKEKLIEKNEAFQFKEAAEKALSDKNYSKETEAYKSYILGKLPKAHIHRRATRYAAKIFLTHVWQVMYFYKYNDTPKLPWVMMQEGHSTFIDMPNKPF